MITNSGTSYELGIYLHLLYMYHVLIYVELQTKDLKETILCIIDATMIELNNIMGISCRNEVEAAVTISFKHFNS